MMLPSPNLLKALSQIPEVVADVIGSIKNADPEGWAKGTKGYLEELGGKGFGESKGWAAGAEGFIKFDGVSAASEISIALDQSSGISAPDATPPVQMGASTHQIP